MLFKAAEILKTKNVSVHATVLSAEFQSSSQSFYGQRFEGKIVFS